MSVKVVTLGAGGYATAYTRPLLDHFGSDKFEYAGVVARNIDACMYADEFREKGIPIYKTIQDFFAERTADLVIISTPPHLHAEHSIYCVEHGANVLCEKPIAPSREEAQAMTEAAKRTGKFIAIAYQHSYTTPILNLKQDIIDGVLGKPLMFKTMVLWPRAWSYYNRGTKWGGKLKDDSGKLILDSVASNAAAHFLHNLLFLLGEKQAAAAIPESVSAELLRANEIENFDTSVLKMGMKNGAEVLFIASHATTSNIEPKFDLEFENATVHYEADGGMRATFKDGTVKDYGEPLAETRPMKHMWDAIDAVTSGKELPCSTVTASAHNAVINSLYEQCTIQDFPEAMVVKDSEQEKTYVPELYDLLVKAYDEGKTLSELGCSWVKNETFTM